MEDITCPHCGSKTDQRKKGHSRSGLARYRCLICERQYTPGTFRRTQKIENEDRVRLCIVCGQETTNPKFCSKSCSATYNNHTTPKRTRKQRFCKYCGTEIETGRTVCDDCKKQPGGSLFDWSGITLADVKANYPKYLVSNIVRSLARRFYRESGRPQKCQRCGYDRYYEVCHIRAISSFPYDTPVLEISALDNLMALCRNCHWEYDHGLLHIEDIPQSNE